MGDPLRVGAVALRLALLLGWSGLQRRQIGLVSGPNTGLVGLSGAKDLRGSDAQSFLVWRAFRIFIPCINLVLMSITVLLLLPTDDGG